MSRVLQAVAAFGMLAVLAVDARATDQGAIDRAVARGVGALRRLRQENGTWPCDQIGATALAGLTLLECGVRADDPDVRRAAEAVRGAGIEANQTYSLSLSILFLDRLGDAQDIPLIESMTVRLLGGQDAGSGGWSYTCPRLGPDEVRRLREHLRQRNELEGRRQPPREPGKRRTVQDLPREIRQQLDRVGRAQAGGAGPGGGTDNSNTQFAVLALWVARRHGLPVEQALARIDARFRTSQNADGGWSYLGGRNHSTATMTCAGLLGLAVAHGSAAEAAHDKGRSVQDINKDPNLRRGLMTLGTVIGNPTGLRRRPGLSPASPMADPRAYYFLWSLERVAVALGLETISKKDWYGWGAEVLLASQRPDGSWQGEYASSGADTCFALLFLRRANLAADLTADLKGVKDPGAAVLKAGGVGGAGLGGVVQKPLTDPITKPDQPRRPGQPERPQPEVPRPVAREPRDPPARPQPPAPRSSPPKGGTPAAREEPQPDRLATALVRAAGAEQGVMLERLRDGKGAGYTDALATAIPKLNGDAKRKAREALADRLTRMKAETLAQYLQDEDAEVRRAAALAAGMKDSKPLIPHLIRLLADREATVARAAHASLKELSGQDFGPRPDATRRQRARAVADWQVWWSRQK